MPVRKPTKKPRKKKAKSQRSPKPRARKKPSDPPVLHRSFGEPSKGDRQRLRICEHAVRIIAQKGPQDLNLETVARSLRVRRSHIVYYFPTLDDLIADCVRYISTVQQDISIEYIESAKTPFEKLERWVRANYDWLIEYPDHGATLLYFFGRAIHSERFRALFEEMLRAGRERVRSLVLNCLASHVKLPGTTYDTLALRLQRMMISYSLLALPKTEDLSFDDAAKANWKDTLRELELAVGPEVFSELELRDNS